MILYTVTMTLTPWIAAVALASTPGTAPQSLTETRTGLLPGHYLVLAEVMDAKELPEHPFVGGNVGGLRSAGGFKARNATLRIIHTYASPGRQVRGTFDLLSGDTPSMAFASLGGPIQPILNLGEIGIWNVAIISTGPNGCRPEQRTIVFDYASFHAFPARKAIDRRYAQAESLASIIERADCIERDEDWIAYLEKYASDNNELIAGWAGKVLSRRGLRDKSLQPFLLALCFNGRHITSQVPVDETLSGPHVLGDKWLFSAPRFAMIKRWFASPVSDVEVALLNDAMHRLKADRAKSGISKEQLLEILRAARVKDIMPADRPFQMPAWLLSAVNLYPNDGPFLCMALDEIQANKNIEARRYLALRLKADHLTRAETMKAILAFDRTMTEERVRAIVESALAKSPEHDGRAPSR